MLGPCGLREWTLWIFRRRRRYRVSGPSMEPALFDGDELLVNPRGAVREGDVVVALHPFQKGLVIVKRVAGVDGDGKVQLSGDNPDESSDSGSLGSFAPDRILGRATSIFSRARRS